MAIFRAVETELLLGNVDGAWIICQEFGSSGLRCRG